MNDDLLAYLVGGLLALAIWSWILYEIIKSATKANVVEKILTQQTKILVELLREKGYDDNRIKDILDVRRNVYEKDEPKP